MRISFQFIPSKRDLLWAAYAGVRARPKVLLSFVSFFIVLPWLAALAILALGKGSDAWIGLALIGLPPVTVAAFAYIPIHLFGNALAMQGLQTYEFSDSEIHLFGLGFDNRVEWSQVTHCLVLSGGVQIYSGKQALISIPRRAFAESTLEALRALLRTKGILWIT